MLWRLGLSVWTLIVAFLQVLLPPACSIIRGINQASTLACARCFETDACRLQLCVVRRKEKDQKFPPAAITHRGGALPMQHLPFFTVGQKYRIPMFLATSFNEIKAYEFWCVCCSRPFSFTPPSPSSPPSPHPTP
jgi:hypothetical protein